MTYPQSTVRYLRVSILNGPETPLQVTGAAVSSVIEVSPQHTPLPSVVVRREEQNAARTTLIEIDLGTYGAPNSRVAVTVPEKNFYRRMTLEGGDDGRTWTPVHQGDIYVFDSSTFRGNSLALDYPENTFRYLRVNVHNEDNPPLSIEKVSVFAFLHRIVFPASPDKAYQIYYGNREARVPSYDLERVFPNLANQELPDAIPGRGGAEPCLSTEGRSRDRAIFPG